MIYSSQTSVVPPFQALKRSPSNPAIPALSKSRTPELLSNTFLSLTSDLQSLFPTQVEAAETSTPLKERRQLMPFTLKKEEGKEEKEEEVENY